MKIMIIEASLNENSLSKKMAMHLQQYLKQCGVLTDVLSQDDVKNIPIYGTTSQDDFDAQKIHARISEADACIWAVPVYCAGVSASAKNILDHFSGALRKKWFAVIAAAGSERSLYALNSFCMEVALESGAIFFPKLTLATQNDFNESGHPSQELSKRLEALGSLFVSVTRQLPRLAPSAETPTSGSKEPNA